MADTTRQELASITTFYYAIGKQAYLGSLKEPAVERGRRDAELYKALQIVYPPIKNEKDTRWYQAFIKQAIVLLKELNNWNASTGKAKAKDTTYKYGRFGSTNIASIPTGRQTVFGDFIWDSFTKDQKELFGKQKKDSWNPMDVYLVKGKHISGMRQEILDSCCVGNDRIAEDNKDAAHMEVQSINQYLTYMTNQKIFIGISLKETDRGDPKCTPTNVQKGFDHIHHSCGMITSPLSMDMEVVQEKKVQGNWVYGLNFITNSLKYIAEFNVGNELKMYTYESKISSRENHATEPRDRVEGARKGFTNSRARNGSVPTPKMAKIVEEFSGQPINEWIPMNRNFNTQEISNWKKLLNEVKDGGSSKKGTKVDWGSKGWSVHVSKDPTVGEWHDNMSVEDWVDAVIAFDNTYEKKTDKFPEALRNKLRAARYIKMFQMAGENKHELDRLLATLYFASAKVNMSKDDLSGPFWKIQ